MPFASPLGATGTAFHDAARAVCADWLLPSAAPAENEPVRSAIPTLLLAGELDPRAPTDFARHALPLLEHGVLIEVPGAGHGVLRVGCAGQVAASFLDDPSREPEAACLTQHKAVDPLGAAHATTGPLHLLRALRHGAWGLPLALAAALLVMLSAIALWPVGALWRRRRGRPTSAAKAGGHLALFLGGLASWAFVVGLARASLRLLGGDHALAIVLGLPGDATALFALPKILLLAAVGGLVLGALAWRRAAWSRFERGHFVLTLAAEAATVVLLAHLQLF